jgi:hypothetical protein
MHIIAELDRRLTEVKLLLQLEEEHLCRVRQHGLDDADAQWLIDLRRRYLKRLQGQREVIVRRRLAAHKTQAEAAAQAAGALLSEEPRVIVTRAARTAAGNGRD